MDNSESEFELASVEDLLRTGLTPRVPRGTYKRGRSSKARPKPEPGVRVGQQRRCSCKECFTCVENARWERIFQEKFADPHYYEKRVRVLQSALSDS